MKQFGIYRECGYLELVALITANDYNDAVQKARSLGYGKSYRIQEEDGLIC